MMRIATAAASGVLFALGLVISELTVPARIIGFLDVGGAWDPTLLYVMGSAILVSASLARLLRRPVPLFAARFHLPEPRSIDLSLVAGAAIFGIGWGLAGYCPGPALVSAGTGASETLVFLAAMIAGMGLMGLAGRRHVAR